MRKIIILLAAVAVNATALAQTAADIEKSKQRISKIQQACQQYIPNPDASPEQLKVNEIYKSVGERFVAGSSALHQQLEAIISGKKYDVEVSKKLIKQCEENYAAYQAAGEQAGVEQKKYKDRHLSSTKPNIKEAKAKLKEAKANEKAVKFWTDITIPLAEEAGFQKLAVKIMQGLTASAPVQKSILSDAEISQLLTTSTDSLRTRCESYNAAFAHYQVADYGRDFYYLGRRMVLTNKYALKLYHGATTKQGYQPTQADVDSLRKIIAAEKQTVEEYAQKMTAMNTAFTNLSNDNQKKIEKKNKISIGKIFVQALSQTEEKMKSNLQEGLNDTKDLLNPIVADSKLTSFATFITEKLSESIAYQERMLPTIEKGTQKSAANPTKTAPKRKNTRKGKTTRRRK